MFIDGVPPWSLGVVSLFLPKDCPGECEVPSQGVCRDDVHLQAHNLYKLHDTSVICLSPSLGIEMQDFFPAKMKLACLKKVLWLMSEDERIPIPWGDQPSSPPWCS